MRLPIDSHDLIQWRFDDALLASPVVSGSGQDQVAKVATIKNYGTASSADLDLIDGLPATGDTKSYDVGISAIFGRGTAFHGGTQSHHRDRARGAAAVEPSVFTWSAWVYPYNIGGTVGMICSKMYRNDQTYASPFWTFRVELFNGEGVWRAMVNVGGSVAVLSVGSANNKKRLTLIRGQWNHIGVTYDGSVIQSYYNGLLGDSVSAPGAVDYGTHGVWLVGANDSVADSNLEQFDGVVTDMRIANIVRTVDYFKKAYDAPRSKYRMRGYDTTTGQVVYWHSIIADSQAVDYTGPGPVTGVVVANIIGL